MKCEDCQIIVEEYVERQVGEREAQKVAAHLRACSDCAAYYDTFAREQEIYARYERDVEVTPALWAAVEARINNERSAPPSLLTRLSLGLSEMFRAPRLSPALAAALVVITIGITVGVMSYLSHQQTAPAGQQANTGTQLPAPVPPPAPASPPGDQVVKSNPNEFQATTHPPKVRRPTAQASPQVTAARLIRDAEQKYVTAIAILTRDFDQRRSKLDPMVLARFDAALANIDGTIRETRRVVRENPDDPAALQYMLAAYAKKVDALRDMARD